MIVIATGDLLQSDCQALVNPVNAVGIMGKGLALEFKNSYQENFRQYAEACRTGKVRLGKVLVTGPWPPRDHFIVNFPTKGHWRSPSRIAWIRDGLVDLVEVIRRLEIRSVAIPAIGCGLGGLEWDDVRGLIEIAASRLPNVFFEVYPPLPIGRSGITKVPAKPP